MAAMVRRLQITISPGFAPMRLPLFLAAAAAVTAIPMAAMAATDPALDAFKTLCWKTQADFPQVLKAADAAGWQNVQLTSTDMEGVSVTDKAAREKSVNGVDMK